MTLCLHFFLLLPLTLTLSSLNPAFAATGAELIQSTCSQTTYPDVCSSSLSSHSASQTVDDLAGLAVIALKQAHAKASKIEEIIHEQLKKAKDGFVQQCLNDCVENFLDSIDQIEDAINSLDSKSYADVNTWITAAMADSESCEEGFKDKPGYTSPLTADTDTFNKLCDNALRITNLLPYANRPCTMYPDVCSSSLGSDSASQTADLAGMAAIALKQAHAKASRIEEIINEQLKKTNDGFMKKCLNDCMENFLGAVDQIQDSINSLDSKGYNDVNTWTTAAIADSESCEEGFKDRPGYTSPLTAETDLFNKLCGNALRIPKLPSA
ncbi:hypothetical protein ACLOJK_017774 [Asimina triloba]